MSSPSQEGDEEAKDHKVEKDKKEYVLQSYAVKQSLDAIEHSK